MGARAQSLARAVLWAWPRVVEPWGTDRGFGITCRRLLRQSRKPHPVRLTQRRRILRDVAQLNKRAGRLEGVSDSPTQAAMTAARAGEPVDAAVREMLLRLLRGDGANLTAYERSSSGRFQLNFGLAEKALALLVAIATAVAALAALSP